MQQIREPAGEREEAQQHEPAIPALRVAHEVVELLGEGVGEAEADGNADEGGTPSTARNFQKGTFAMPAVRKAAARSPMMWRAVKTIFTP